MTEQEAQALATRLSRIWKPNAPVSVDRYSDGESGKAETWLLHAHLGGDLELELYTSKTGDMSSIHLTRWIGGKQDRAFLLTCEQERDWNMEDTSDLRQGEIEALLTFRRGCWLSGCAIEANAHEKAEWMRGFTKEEVEAWDLTF